ncbi:MAG: hypothetical protein GQ477_03580 [Nanohaloarchaea archaeon]|nr:hypothetical protein [Candidatus Nanohaloarchaea archaeon]
MVNYLSKLKHLLYSGYAEKVNDPIENAKSIIDDFNRGISIKERDIIFAVNQIRCDCPEDPIIQYLKELDCGDSFYRAAEKIKDKYFIYSEGFKEMYALSTQRLNNMLHMHPRELTLVDDFFRLSQDISIQLEERILDDL